MILWNKIRRNAEEGMQTIKKSATFVAGRARIEASLAKNLFESERIERKIKVLYQKIGELVYTMTSKKEKNILKDTAVTDALEEIAKLKDDLNRLQREARFISSGEVEGHKE